MKKITTSILLVCILMMQLFTMISCNDGNTPAAETSSVVLTPSESTAPSTTKVEETTRGEETTEPEETEPEETEPEETEPEETEPEETEPEETEPEETEPEETEPEETEPEETEPEETDPEETPAAPNEIKNIILIIGDGMGLDHIAAAQMMYQKQYGFTSWQFTTANTDCAKSTGQIDLDLATDSAAGATALASGKLAVRQTVGKDYTGRDVTTILDRAKRLGKSTGIVTTDALHGATPASFSAHVSSRYDQGAIVQSQLGSGVDLLCGHIDSVCTSRVSNIRTAGYAYCDNFANVGQTMTATKAYWQLDLGGSNDQAMNATVSLKDATLQAIRFLERDEDGFALMIEQAHVDKYAHSGDLRGTTYCVNSLNDTVEGILEWLGDRTDTAIVITADHETGGLSVSYEERYANSMKTTVANADGARPRVYYHYADNDHTDANVGVFVYGIDVDFSKFSYYGSEHVIKNTNVYDLLADVLAHPLEYGKREE